MAYLVRIKGHDDVRISDREYSRIVNDWKEYKKGDGKNKLLEDFHGFTGTLSDIYNFKQVSDDSKSVKQEKTESKHKKIDREHREDYERRLKLSPKERGQDMQFAEAWQWIITGSDDMTYAEKMKYEAVQQAFFEDNPYRTLPDLQVLDRVKPRAMARSDSEPDTRARGGLVRLMIGMLRNDNFYARQKAK